MPLPQSDVDRIIEWCAARVPDHLRDKIRVEADVAATHVTIIETRPPWDGVGDWTRFPIARLRYTATQGTWRIYWRDRHSRFHVYDRKRPTKTVQPLLDFIGSHEDPVFWG